MSRRRRVPGTPYELLRKGVCECCNVTSVTAQIWERKGVQRCQACRHHVSRCRPGPPLVLEPTPRQLALDDDIRDALDQGGD
jgi:hypothetical protein